MRRAHSILQKINVAVEYVTTSELEVTRTLRLSRVVATSLPVAINVEDFFRGTRSVFASSLFETLTDHLQALHALHAVDDVAPTCARALHKVAVAERGGRGEGHELHVAEAVRRGTCLQLHSSEPGLNFLKTITPAQPGRFLFQMDASRGQGKRIVRSVRHSGLNLSQCEIR